MSDKKQGRKGGAKATQPRKAGILDWFFKNEEKPKKAPKKQPRKSVEDSDAQMLEDLGL